jgi:arginase family enzyme
MPRTLVLDFDGSVAPLDGAETIPLGAMQEAVRFGCRRRVLERLPPLGDPALVFLGSGDFHHVTYALLARMQRPMQVVVFDNHPDNMRYPFGIHCGSWVSHAARLPFVSRIHVAGITSPDVEGAHAVENRLGLLRSVKIVYWCVRRDLRALRRLGVRASQSFDSIAEMLGALGDALSGEPVYLSIDKDVLAADVVRTNWDQGVMRIDELDAAIAMLRGRLVAADVTGDASVYRYRSRFKRLLSALDRQPEIPAASLAAWRRAHRDLNLRLLSLLRPRQD